MHKKTQLLSINFFLQLVILYCFCLPLTAHADTNSGVTWLIQQSQEIGSYSSETDIATPIQATAEAWRTLSELGHSPATQPSMSDALAFLKAEPSPSTEYLARQLIVRTLTNEPVAEISTELTKRIQEDGGLSDLPDHQRTLIDTAFALEAIALANFANTSVEQLYYSIDFILKSPIFDRYGKIDDDVMSMYIAAITVRSLWHYRNHVRHIPNLDIPALSEKLQSYLLEELAAGTHETFEIALALIAIIPRLPNLDSVSSYLETLKASQLPNGSWDNDVYTTALVLRILHTANQPITNPDLGKIVGTVIDNKTNSPIPAVTITLSGKQSATEITDDIGQFEFTGLFPGDYTVEISDESGTKITSEVTLVAGEVIDLQKLNLLQTTNATIIQGNVTNKVTQQTLENIAITVIGTGFNKTLLTDNQGAYFIADIPAGDITLEINQAGYSPVSASVTVKKGSNAVVPLELSPTSTVIKGIITDAQTGEALEQANILVDGNVVFQTDEKGQYRVEGVSGTFFITVEKEGYTPYQTEIVIETNTNVDFSPKLYPEGVEVPNGSNAAIRGTVIDENTQNVLADVGVSCNGNTVYTNGLGQFTCVDLSAGEVQLEFSFRGYQTKAIVSSIENFTLIDIGTIPLIPDNLNTITGIKGLMMDNGTRQFLTNTTVQAQFGETTYSAVSAEDGSVTIEIPSSFTGDAVLSVEGYKPINIYVSLTEKEVLDLGFVLLNPLGTIALLPDLIGEQFDLNTLTTDFDTLQVRGNLTIAVKNQGTATTSHPISIRVFNDTDINSYYDANTDITLAQTTITEPLLPNTEVIVNIPIDGELPFRDAPILVVLDHEEKIVELNEVNNIIYPISQCTQSSVQTIDLAICLDTSPSVNDTQLDYQLNGMAKAIEDNTVVPHDNSVRLSVIQFAAYARVEVSPTFINSDNAQEIANKVRNIKRWVDGTAIHKCINLAVSELSSVVPATDFQIINLSTDGESSRELALQASLAAQEAGINALNGIAVGSGADISLLDEIVFPQPAGGKQGYVTSFSNYIEYTNTIGNYIGGDTQINSVVGSMDFSAARFYVTKNYNDNKASLHVRIGKGGKSKWPASASVTFWEGKPDEGGRFLGRTPVDVPTNPNQHYQDVQLDGVIDLTTEKTLYAITDSGLAAECNYDNNIISTQVKDFTGYISLALDAAEYKANSLVHMTYTVTNEGILTLAETLPSDFIVTPTIQNADGQTIATLEAIDIATLNAGESYRANLTWNTGEQLTGAYRVKLQLTNTTGQIVDEESKLFNIIPSNESNTQLIARTDKPTYYSYDIVQIHSTVYNQSNNHLIDDALVKVTIKNAEQNIVYTKTRALNTLPPNEKQALLFPYRPYWREPLGDYTVQIDLIDHNSTVLNTETSAFSIVETAETSLSGYVSSGKITDTVRGFNFVLDNNGKQTLTDLPIRQVLFDVDEQAIVFNESKTITIEPSKRYYQSTEYYTYLLPHSNYAALLQVNINGEWQTIDFEPFILHHELSSQCSKVYAVHDEGVNHSQLFTYDLDQGVISKLGPLYSHRDIEGMDINPKTYRIYASTGRRNSQLYLVDGHTGNLTPIGLIGFDHVTALSFNHDGTLWGWSNKGLITIDIQTGQGTLVFESDLPVEGIAWDAQYSTVLHLTSYSLQDKSSTLWQYRTYNNTFVKQCSGLPGEIESLEGTDNHQLVFGVHGDNNLRLYAYDTRLCEVIDNAKLITSFNDVEAIAWPSTQCTPRHDRFKTEFTKFFETGSIYIASDGNIAIYVYKEGYHRGQLAETTEQGETPADGELQLREIADANEDGMSDFLIIYPDGVRQVFYYYGLR